MEDCSKTGAGAVAGLPDDLLVEILSHVPAKSICRFKCVSKAWRDLMADRDHRKKLRQAMQGFLIMIPAERTDHFCFDFIDLTGGYMHEDVDDPEFFSLMEQTGMVLLDSCNGLMLFGHHKKPPHYAGMGDIVCNPTTKQWEYVPTCGSPDRFKNTFLAFDPAVSSQFHLLQFQISEVDERLETLHAYTSETGIWSHNQIDSQGWLLAGHHRNVKLSYDDPRCAYLNGFLYLVVVDLDQLCSDHIVAVDVQGKARKMIPVPGADDVEHFMSCHLELSQGRLHCMTRKIFCVNYKLEIWVPQDYDTQEWVLKNIVSSGDVCGELTGGIFDDLNVLDIHQDSNIIYLFDYGAGQMIAYDMDHKELSDIATFEYRKGPVTFARYVPCFLEIPSSHKLEL